MKRCHFLALAFSAALSGAFSSAAPPNFLVLLADDMRADAIHTHGNPHIRTPNLDKLAAEGFSFREAHCFGSNSGAVCVPSRAMLMTGKAWFHVKNDLSEGPTLPQRLAECGYQTFLAGKWHNGARSCETSFHSGNAVFLGGMTDQFRPNLSRLENGKLSAGQPSSSYSTDAIADAAIQFLGSRANEKPFFAWVSFTVPHDPRTPKPEHAALYDAASLPLPRDFLPQHPFDNGWLTVRDEELLGWPREPDEIKREIARYYALITHLDQRVGDILQALEKSGASSRTFVFFLADHGLALGSHGLLGKQSLYEHSMRAPFIVRGPGVLAGKESHALTYLHDLHPTVLSLVSPANHSAHELENSPVAARSLIPLWRGEKESWRDRMLLAFTDTMRAVRGARWKLIVYPQIHHAQLFDLESDPHETNDVAGRHPDQVATLMRDLSELQMAAGDGQPLRVAHPKDKELNLRGRKANPNAAIPGGANR